MPKYHVEILAEFDSNSPSSTALRQKIIRLLKSEGFEERNFEIGISLVKKVKEGEISANGENISP